MSKDYRHRDFDDEFSESDGKSENFNSEETGRRKNANYKTNRNRSRKAKQSAKYAAFSR